MNIWKSLLFDNETAWTKKNHSDMLDVTMGMQLRRSGSLWAYRSFPPEQPQQGKKQRRTLQRRSAGIYKKRKRTTIRTDKKGHHTRIQETRTEHFYKHIPKNLQLTRRHPKPHGRNLLPIPKVQHNNETLNIDSNSNHPPTIIKHLPAAIGRRIFTFPQAKNYSTKRNRTTKVHLNKADTTEN